MARKRDADNLAQKDAQLVFWTVQNPRFARLEHQSREELSQFFDYYTKQLESLNARHESYLSQSLKAKWNSARTLLDSVVERQNKTLSSVDDLHVRQEAQLIQQQSSKELKLNVHIERLQKHWNSIIPNSSLHRSHLQEQMESLKRLQRRHSLEIKFLREAQQRIQDDIHERFIKERKVAAETQQRRERRASNMISREESIFQTAFQRRLESLWKLWALRWEELCLQLRLESHGQYARFRPTWLQEVDKEEVRFAITELRSVLITHYGKETVDQLVGSLAGEEKESDSVSLWEWEDEGEDDGEDIDYHDFVRPWKKARKATRQSL
ncbi:hypothetical protein HOO65_010350 [Ceratocystis lukuohia]|uniref:Uncharacterized protein n=3 Tax=Ceratocystis TaxID=5157 RepID=A0A0F8DLD3_CERFI|nr:hypothetical protein CFO_g971 [Ceratocystis platani]PHH54231.1 hypothetical protein CFIMG_003011RAa [Ceratocystis fimbriata CBS 114723]